MPVNVPLPAEVSLPAKPMVEPSAEAMRVRTALVPFVHAGVPWSWFGFDAWCRGERATGEPLLTLLVVMSAGFVAAGIGHAVVLRRCGERLAPWASSVLALASPFAAAAFVGLFFSPLAWFGGESGLGLLALAVQFPASLLHAAPLRFLGTMVVVGWLSWLLVRPALRDSWRRAVAAVRR